MARSNVQRRWYLSHPSRPPVLWWQFFCVRGLLLSCCDLRTTDGKRTAAECESFRNLGSHKNHTSRYAVSGWAGCPKLHTCVLNTLYKLSDNAVKKKKKSKNWVWNNGHLISHPQQNPIGEVAKCCRTHFSEAMTLCAFGLSVRKCHLYNTTRAEITAPQSNLDVIILTKVCNSGHSSRHPS